MFTEKVLNKKLKIMKMALKTILLLLHFIIVCIAMYYLGDFMSQPINILLILGCGLIYSGLMISIIAHTYQFILSLKKYIKS
jgi:hypothetical protein